MKQRIVVTGMGTVNPLGNSVEELWKNIREGKSGIGLITRFDTTEFATKIAGEVRNFDPGMFMEKKEARKMALFSQYAVAATSQALQQAGIKEGDYDPARVGMIIGNGIGGFEIIEEAYRQLYDKGPARLAPMIIPKMISNEAPANIGIIYNFQGPCVTINTACASGTDAIGNALMALRSGWCDMAVAGGTEGCVVQLGVGGFNALQALSTAYNDTPELASRPFDKTRDGFVLAEGAGILILETLERAQKRGATILAELAGYGMTNDAYHLTAPHPECRGAARAMEIALADAELKPEDIDYVNAHGTSTPTNDPLETLAIKKVFGDHAYKLKVSSTKSMTGHCIGAAGAIEAIISILAIRDQYFPATINLNEPDEACDLDYVPNKGYSGRIRAVMSNSLGFGGHNGMIVLKEFE